MEQKKHYVYGANICADCRWDIRMGEMAKMNIKERVGHIPPGKQVFHIGCAKRLSQMYPSSVGWGRKYGL